MGSRYYISGVQLGMLMAFIEQGGEATGEALKLLKEIEENQFIEKAED